MKNIPLYDVRKIDTLKDMLESSTKLFGNDTAFLVKTEEGGSYQPITYTRFYEDVNAMGLY